MNKQPRDANGQFMSVEELSSDEEVEFLLSEFECRVIGNRLRRLGERYKKIHSKLEVKPDVHQDCFHWARRFHKKCSTRTECDEEYHDNGEKRHVDSHNTVKVNITGYECWSIGLRLYEMGEWFEEKGHERVANEAKWLARRFHAEEKKQSNRR